MPVPDFVSNPTDTPPHATVFPRFRWNDYTVSVNTTPPVVAGITPTPPTRPTPAGTVSVSVTDDAESMRLTLITCKNGPSTEVVWDGAAFLYPFAGSTREAIADGWRYDIRRSGNWRNDPIRFNVYAIDTAGNEAT